MRFSWHLDGLGDLGKRHPKSVKDRGSTSSEYTFHLSPLPCHLRITLWCSVFLVLFFSAEIQGLLLSLNKLSKKKDVLREDWDVIAIHRGREGSAHFSEGFSPSRMSKVCLKEEILHAYSLQCWRYSELDHNGKSLTGFISFLRLPQVTTNLEA